MFTLTRKIMLNFSMFFDNIFNKNACGFIFILFLAFDKNISHMMETSLIFWFFILIIFYKAFNTLKLIHWAIFAI